MKVDKKFLHTVFMRFINETNKLRFQLTESETSIHVNKTQIYKVGDAYRIGEKKLESNGYKTI